MKKQILISISLMIIGSMALCGCSLNGGRPDGSGTIECTQIRVAPGVSGRIVALVADEGYSVTNGQVIARIDPSAYELRLAEASAASRLAEQELKRIKEIFAKNSATEQQVEAATAMAEQASARMALAQKALNDCEIKSTAAGTLTSKTAEEGEVVSIGTPLFILSCLDSVWLSVYLPEPRLASIKLGQKAEVKVDGRDERFEGTVTYISSVAEFSPKNVQTSDERAKLVYRVKVSLPNEEGVFKPGMPADAWLEQSQ